MKIITDPRCTAYSLPQHPERPARITETIKKLESQKKLSIEWEKPDAVSEEQLLRAHSAMLVKSLNQKEDFDADTAAHPGIADHSRRSVGSALKALELSIKGHAAFSLIRPPGHHATRETIMGFCYLNSIAISALEAGKKGYKRVAVFDFDVHHGNGTEDVLMGREGFEFFSIHQLPGYPGTGGASIKNSRNYPVKPGRPREEYRGVLERAIEDLKDFKPDLIAVSAGFDAFKNDPLSNARLEVEDFHWLGRTLGAFKMPVYSVLEGGYSEELPELIYAYMSGFSETYTPPIA